MELDFSFGMRCYQVLFTDERGPRPKFCCAAGRYMLVETPGEGGDEAVVFMPTRQGPVAEVGKMSAAAASSDRPGVDDMMRGSTVVSSGEGRSRVVELPEGGRSVTILKRRTDGKNGNGGASFPQPLLVERGSHGEYLGGVKDARPLVELSSRGDPSRGGSRRPTDQVRTGGYCEKSKGAQVPECMREKGRDMGSGCGSMDSRVEWRARIPSTGVAAQVAPRGKEREAEVVANEVAVLSDVESDVVAAQLAALDNVTSNAVKRHQLGATVYGTRLESDPVLDGPGKTLGTQFGPPIGRDVNSDGVDPVVEVMGQLPGLDQGDGLSIAGSGMGDPILLCEVDQGLEGYNVRSRPLLACEKIHEGDATVGVMGDILSHSQINFGDSSRQPDVVPPTGFSWKFSEGVWALFPECPRDVMVDSDLGDPVQEDYRSEGKEDSQTTGIMSSDGDDESDDSVTKFERNLKELLPGLQGGSPTGGKDPPKGSRRSERQKKPSSRFNTEAGFLPEPPRSSKKRAPSDGVNEGTSSKPLLISDWTDAQLAKYCNSCGIDFTDSVEVSLNSLRLLELARANIVSGQAETSSEVRGSERCL